MKSVKNSLPSNDIITERLKWLELAYGEFRRGGATAYLGNSPASELLISGLREADPVRWDIGILDAEPICDPSDGSQSVVITYGKPSERRQSGESDWTRRRFDLPAVLVQQLHVLFGGRLRLRTSASHVVTPEHPNGVPYHYPLIGIPIGPSKQFDFRALRAILNAPPNRLAKAYEEFHDLRRRNLSVPWMTQEQATAIFGAQKKGPYHTRSGATEASLRAYDRNGPLRDSTLDREGLRVALNQAYELLDCHPLKVSDVA